MPVVRVNPLEPEPDVIARAAEVLRAGGLVAFPTETVYGLGAHALDPEAVARIYEAKGRPAYNPIIVHVESAAAARVLASEWPPEAELLGSAFWPGPLTLVLPRAEAVPDIVTAGLPRVGLRVPANAVALALLRAARLPVAAPSANRSMQLSPTRAEHVVRALGEDVLVLDGGETSVGIESTVLDPTSIPPRILRPGTISATDIAAVLRTDAAPRTDVASVGSLDESPGGDSARESPGQLDRHYSPRAEVRLFPPSRLDTTLAAVREAAARGVRVAVLTRGEFAAPGIHHVRMPDGAAEFARRLYSTLHALDDGGCQVMWIEMVPEGSEWDGVRDRLRRAAHTRGEGGGGGMDDRRG